MARKKNVIAVMSPKGGVGKTVTTANLAAALSSEFNKKILVVDTNVSTASLGMHLDIFYPKTTIHDTVEKNFPVRKAIHLYDTNFHVIPASIKIKKKDKNLKDVRTNVHKIISNYDDILNQLSKEYHLILLDCSPGFDLEAIGTMHVAGGLIIVANPDYPSIVSAAKAIEYAKSLKVPLGGIVLNKVDNKKHEIKDHEIEKALKVKIIGKVPFDKKVPESIAHRTPIVLLHPGNQVSVAYKKIAGSLIGEEYKDSFLRRLLGY